MRTLLRSIRSGEYLESPETWTAMAGDALDFQSVARALDLVRRRGLRDMELILVEDPARPTSVPVEKLRLSPSFHHTGQAETRATERKPGKKRVKAIVLAPATRRPVRKARKTASAARSRRKLRSALAKN